MQFGAAERQWGIVRENAERYLAVNPMATEPYRQLADVAADANDLSTGIVAWRTLLQLDPPDPTEAHYQLARLLHKRGEYGEAKREVLLALEETPRFRAALQLLKDINRAASLPTAPLSPRS
jgi:hypothetical protein